jgi:SAM-dependent methyltransferase
MQASALQQRLIERAAGLYRCCGRSAYYFARGKLAGDPVFTTLLADGLIPDHARVLDLGSGQGLLAAWLLAAETAWQSGERCLEWPPPPASWSFRGIELMPRAVANARRALGAHAVTDIGDIRSAVFGAADVIVLLDVLHYVDRGSQDAILARARAALPASGRLLLRIGDAGAGLAFHLSTWVDRLVLLAKGRGWVPLSCRSLRGWTEALEQLGFAVDARPMSARTPFANVLLVASPR